jgi:predicted nucleic acid-binding protein
MSRVVLLDTSVLGMVTNPRATPETTRCRAWLQALLTQAIVVAIPEIADYELRRELLRARRDRGIARLDLLTQTLGYLPITTTAMRKAAAFWAEARQQGRPTADEKALDGDVILAAQASLLAEEGEEAVIATTNVDHLAWFVEAHEWWTIHA